MPRVLQRRLGEADGVEGVGGILGVQQFQRGQQEGRKRLVECEIVRQVHGRAVVERAVRQRFPLQHIGRLQRGEDLGGALDQRGLLLRGLQAVLYQLEGAGPGVASAFGLREHDGVRDAQARLQLLGRRGDQLVESRFAPVHEPFRRMFLLYALAFLLVVAGTSQRTGILYLVLGSLRDDQPLGVESGAARASGDLVEFAGA